MPSVEINPDDFAVVLAMHRALNRATHAAMAGSLTDYRVLACVDAYAGTCRGVDICRANDLSRSATSMALTRLVNRDQITYQGTGNSRRATITSSGHEALVAAHAALLDTVVREAPNMSPTDRMTHERLMIALAARLGANLLGEREVDMAHVYVGACSRTKQIIRRTAEDHGLTANGLLVLCGIVGWNQPMRPTELAWRLRLPKPLFTMTYRRLVADGFAQVCRDGADARSKCVLATAEGNALLRRAHAAYWEAYFARTGELTAGELAFFRSVNARRAGGEAYGASLR